MARASRNSKFYNVHTLLLKNAQKRYLSRSTVTFPRQMSLGISRKKIFKQHASFHERHLGDYQCPNVVSTTHRYTQ
jgi:hypothetical protein